MTRQTETPASPVAASRRISAESRRKALLISLQLGLVIAALLAWEFGARSGAISRFLFASPLMIWDVLVQRSGTGELLRDVRATSVETLLGYALGAIGGSVLGLGLWYSRFVSDFAAPFIAAVGSIPVLAVAPMTIIWFGTGLTAKVVIVAFSCVVVSLTTSYRGAMRTDPDFINLMRSFNAGRSAIFFKLIVPAAMPWVLQGLKLNVGFALIGAIVAEYISSDAGVGHMILLGSSNFSMNIVLAGILLVMVMMLVFNFCIGLLERAILRWERK
ncbi:ABC transporter permease [Pseudogemmobacter humi]|uniref:Aliphatic sulfonates transport permease protein SsuC n=1 Tax=Pseudogemmobacter humi TaxID=2483812 RepID=A0A3P5XK01_9RHOB|nr:ABC transporter permease [Pseudogemmobacter humi]VDC30504.1 Putative aliphatic sulfonates transport permease protein SsuC [Pseudogemmobacter humi]